MRTLVLLPGVDGTGSLFGPFRRSLGESVPSLVVSYPKERWLSYDELECLTLWELPCGGSYVILAESFSGPVAIRIASRKPTGLRGIILCASFAKSPAPKWLHWFAQPFIFRIATRSALSGRFLLDSECSPSLAARVTRAIQSVSPTILARRLEEALRVDVTHFLKKCEVPVMYLAGTKDRILGARGLNRIKAVKPEVTSVCIAGPHLLLQCRPREIVQVILPVLDAWFAD